MCAQEYKIFQAFCVQAVFHSNTVKRFGICFVLYFIKLSASDDILYTIYSSVTPREPCLDIAFEHLQPSLIDEIFPLRLRIDNKEKTTISNVK